MLADALNDKGKVTKASVTQRLKSIRNVPESNEESKVLTKCLVLIEADTKSDKAVKEAQAALDEQVLARYASLTEAEIKSLVVGDKWFASIDSAIKGEVQRITQQLAGPRQGSGRNAMPPRLPELEREVEALQRKGRGTSEKDGAVAMREAPEGYKRTKVGVIPNAWDIMHLGDLFVFKNGLNKAKHFFGTGTPIVNYMDVFELSGIRMNDISGTGKSEPPGD